MISVGIDIGSYSIKVAEAKADAKGYRLGRFDEYPLSQDPHKDRQIEIIEVLRNIAQRYENGPVKFVVAVGQGQVSLRHLEFPFKERHKILKSLPFELEDAIPLSLDDAIYKARIIRYTRYLTDVLAVACPKTHVAATLRQAQDGGIDPEIISVKGMAEANLFEPWVEAPLTEVTSTTASADQDRTETDEEPAAEIATSPGELILDIGHRTTTAIVLKQGRLIDARHIDWGGQDIATAIANHYSLHFTEAIKELQTKAFILLNAEDATREQKEFSDVIKGETERLTHHLNLLLLEFRAQHDIEFQQITLVGGTSRIRNLGLVITQALELPTNRLKGLAAHPQLDFAGNPNNEISSLVAMGLAVEGIKRPKNPAINLRKNEFATQSQSVRLWWQKWSHTTYITAVAYVLFVAFAITRSFWTESMAAKAQDVLTDQAKKVAQLKPKDATPGKIKKYIRHQKEAAKNAGLMENLTGMNSALDILEAVSAVAPAKNVLEMNIKHFSVQNDRVTISGEGRPGKGISFLENALKGVALKGQVKAVSSDFKAQAGFSPFAFSFTVDRKVGDAQ